jgi:hypothetical protein
VELEQRGADSAFVGHALRFAGAAADGVVANAIILAIVVLASTSARRFTRAYPKEIPP